MSIWPQIVSFWRSCKPKPRTLEPNLGNKKQTKHQPAVALDTLSSPLEYSLAQKMQLLTFARSVLASSTAEPEGFTEFYTRWQKSSEVAIEGVVSGAVMVDVILWVDGYLRGSQFVEGQPLFLGIYEAVLRAREDGRFKPISVREYERVRIELVIIDKEPQLLTKAEINQNEIQPEQAYLGVAADGRRSWFVPATLNCRNFKDLRQYLDSLKEEKLCLSSGEIQPVTFYKAGVVNFIESADHKEVRTLSGVRLVSTDQPAISKEQLLSRALDFVLLRQDPDGNFQPTISPFAINRLNTVDWVRSTFLLYAVTLAIKKYPDLPRGVKYSAAAEASYEYLKKYLPIHKSISPLSRCLGLIYLYQVAVLGEDKAELPLIHKQIIALFPGLPYEPIFYTQFALHVYTSSLRSMAETKLAKTAIEEVLADFNQKQDGSDSNRRLELALYADLPNALKIASEVLERQEFAQAGRTIHEWFKIQQKPDGSLPGILGRNFSHSRGTSKILESLATYGLAYSDPQFLKALTWLHSLQYSQDNSYFVPIEQREKLLGGFRHDQQNATAWIDSSAHYLVAISR